MDDLLSRKPKMLVPVVAPANVPLAEPESTMASIVENASLGDRCVLPARTTGGLADDRHSPERHGRHGWSLGHRRPRLFCGHGPHLPLDAGMFPPQRGT